MKKLLYLILLLSFAFSCTPENSPQDPGTDPVIDPGTEPQTPPQDPPAPKNRSHMSSGTVSITAISDLNPDGGELNSHSGLLGRSHLSPISGTYLTLDKDFLGDRPVYPRFTKTADGEYIMFYHNGNESTYAGNQCSFIRSRDLKNWSYGSKLFSWYNTKDQYGTDNMRMYAGAFPVTLPNGDILVVASTRMKSNYHYTNDDNGLAIRRSTDGGKTWSPDDIIHVGTNWEPFVLVLPSGKIQIYYTDSDHLTENVWDGVIGGTGTAMIESEDNGYTWTPPGREGHLHVIRQVRATSGPYTIYTDQMPAVVKLNGTDRLFAAAESNMGLATADYYISLAWSDENGDWGTAEPNRDCPSKRVNKYLDGCAPFISVFPSGETLLTYNANNIFYMLLGDENGENFQGKTKVFGTEGKEAGKGFWGSTFLLDSHRVLASVGGSNFLLQMGQYYLNHAIKAARMTPSVDASNQDWKDCTEALYLCSSPEATATLRAAADSDSLYFLVEVADEKLVRTVYDEIYLARPSDSSVSESSLRIRTSMEGLVSAASCRNGVWQNRNCGIHVDVKYQNKVGYVAEISVPRQIIAPENGELLVNFALGGSVSDRIAQSDTNTGEWIPITGY